MKRVWIFFILGIFIISSALAAQSIFGQTRWHQAGEISIIMNNHYSNFVGDSTFGHNNSEIYVNVGGVVKTLDIALTDKSLNDTPRGKSPSNYNNPVIFGEIGDNIIVKVSNVDKTLQQAINDGDFFMGCYDGATVRLDGENWTAQETYGYSCGCSKDGCSTCYATRTVTKICLSRIISKI